MLNGVRHDIKGCPAQVCMYKGNVICQLWLASACNYNCKGVSHDSLISVILMPAALQMRMHDMPFYSTNFN